MDQPTQRRGLGALLQDTTRPTGATSPSVAPVIPASIPLTAIRPNKNQPRTNFDAAALEELSQSIKAKGIIQPIIVRRTAPSDQSSAEFELIAGERRWRAAQIAGLTAVPAIVRDDTDTTESFVISLIENLQRDDLNPVEEAVAFKRLCSDFQIAQDQIGLAIGKSRAYVSNAIRLLDLPEHLLASVRSGALSVGHAKVLLGIPDPKIQTMLAARCRARGLTVRQLESMVDDLKKIRAGVPSKTGSGGLPHPETISDIERALSQKLGTRVRVVQGRRKGEIIIEFYSVADFDRLSGLLGL